MFQERLVRALRNVAKQICCIMGSLGGKPKRILGALSEECRRGAEN